MATEKMISMLKNLIQKTTEKKIDWKLINPQALRWTRTLDGKPVTVTLQTQERPTMSTPRRKSYYIFSIQSPQEALLQINSYKEADYHELLENLFIVAINFTKDSSAGLIDKLLDGIE
jgi:hypothetical protein